MRHTSEIQARSLAFLLSSLPFSAESGFYVATNGS